MELNINDLNKNSLIMKWNVDANNNPAAVYITNEVQQVSTTHNIIQLAQVPDEYMKMRIVSETDELVEVFNRREIAPTTYYVDYGCGLVYFHESLAGQLVKADYYGRGIILLSDKRVFHTVGGDFAYTLDELITKGQDAVDLLESAGGLSGALDLIDEKVQEGNQVADRIEGFVDATEFYGYTIILSREAFVVKAKEDGNVDVTEINSVFSDVIVYKGGQQITPTLSIDSSTNCVFSITGQRIILESLDVATIKGQAVVNIDCGDGLVAQRTIEVTKVFDGVSQYQVNLTNTFYSFNATSDGNIETEQEVIVDIDVTKGNEEYLGYEVIIQNMPSGLVYEMASNINPNSITFRANTGSSLPDSSTVAIIFKLDSETTVSRTFSFNKAKHGLNARALVMTGNQIFKYEREDYSDIPVPNYTTLNIQATGLSGTPIWYYKDVDGNTWTEITGQTSNTFVLSHNNAIWNDKKEITVKCELDGMSDELTIIKISSSHGDDAYSMLLTNESTVVPVDENGEVSDNEIVKQYTQVFLYKGTTRIEPITITVQPSDDNWYETAITDDKVYLTALTPDELSVVIPITVEIDGLSFTKTWTVAKAQKGNDGVNGESGSSYVLNVIGGTRSITYSQINTDPRPSISGQFSATLYKNGQDVSGEVTNWYWTTSGHLSGNSLTDTFTPTIATTLNEALTNNSVEVTATHDGMPITYTVPIAITKDSAGLDWIADWDSTKVSIRDQEVLTPKIFAGTYDEASDSVTGVAIGSDILNDGQTIGVAGYQNNQVSFLLDTDGSLIIGDPYTANSVGIGYDNGQLVISVSDLQIRGIQAATTQDIVTTVDQMSEDLRVDLQSGIDSANSSVNDLNIYLDEVVRDGLISEVEKAKLQGLYENVVQEVNGVEAQYKAVREHPLLTDTTVIATLEAAHDDYVIAYTEVFDAYTELITLAGTIQDIDVPDGEVDPVIPPGGTPDSDVIGEVIDPVDTNEDLEQGIGNDDPAVYTPVSSERFVRAIENYKVAAGNLYEEMNKANLSISEAKAQQIVNNAKQEIQVEIQDTQDALNELENTMNNEFKTGLIGNINLAILEERLHQLGVEKKDIDNQYNVLVNNTILDNTIKTDLIQVKSDLDIAHDALIAKINAVIGDGLFTEQEMNDVNTLISTYGTELGDYSKVAQEANVDIAVKNAQQAVELMTQEQVFNKLTDNGNIQGLFMDNGQLYVNGEYINTRNFKAVTDDGEQTFLIDADGNVHLNVKSFTLEGKTITEVYDQTLTQEKVFNVLTDNGNTQGIYLQNGQLYINGEYINTRNFSATNENGEQTFLIDENGNVHINAENFTLGGSSVTTQQDVIDIFNSMSRSENLLTQPTFNDGIGTWQVSVSNYIKKDTTHVREVDGVTSEAVKLNYTGTSNALALWTNDWTIDKLTANTKYTAKAHVYFEDTSTLTGNMTLRLYGTVDGTSTLISEKAFTASDFENGKWNEISMEVTTTQDYDNPRYQLACSKGCVAWVTDCAVYSEDSLTQEELVEILNGAGDGFYLIDDKLYINADYIQTGTLRADLVKVQVDATTNLLPFNYLTMKTGINDGLYINETNEGIPTAECEIPIYQGGGSNDWVFFPFGYSDVEIKAGEHYWFIFECYANWGNDYKLDDYANGNTSTSYPKQGGGMYGSGSGNCLNIVLANQLTDINSEATCFYLCEIPDFDSAITVGERENYAGVYERKWTRFVTRIDATRDYRGQIWFEMDGAGFDVGDYGYFVIKNMELLHAGDSQTQDQIPTYDYFEQIRNKHIELTDGVYYTGIYSVDGINLTEGTIHGTSDTESSSFNIDYDGFRLTHEGSTGSAFVGEGKSYYSYNAGSSGTISGFDKLFGFGATQYTEELDWIRTGIFTGVHYGFQKPNSTCYGRPDIYVYSDSSNTTAWDDWTDWELLGQKVEPLGLVRRNDNCSIATNGLVIQGDATNTDFSQGGTTYHGSVIFSEPLYSTTSNGQIINVHKDNKRIYFGNPNSDVQIEGSGISVRFGTSDPSPVICKANLHDSIYIGAQDSSETGRSIKDWGVHSYNLYSKSLANGDGTSSAYGGYWSLLTFGNGTSGAAQLAIDWTSGGKGFYMRSLRDTGDNWFKWKRIGNSDWVLDSTSDERYKRAISDVSTEDCYNMVKNIELHSYLLLTEEERYRIEKGELDADELFLQTVTSEGIHHNLQMGVLAQDMLKYSCGTYVVNQDILRDEHGELISDRYGIDAYNYASAILGGLQEEIKVRDAQYEELKNEIQELKQIINELKGE